MGERVGTVREGAVGRGAARGVMVEGTVGEVLGAEGKVAMGRGTVGERELQQTHNSFWSV